MLQMLGVFAEFEHSTIVERTKVGMEKKARGGTWVGGVVPYGYQLDPEKGLVIHEEEAVIVKKMFKLYGLGKEGTHSICHKLNDAGHRNRRGKKWDKRVILHMIKNPLYVGKLRWREVIYEGNHDPIIAEVLFEKAQAIMKERVEDLNGRRFHNGDERLLAGNHQVRPLQEPHGGRKHPQAGTEVPVLHLQQALEHQGLRPGLRPGRPPRGWDHAGRQDHVSGRGPHDPDLGRGKPKTEC